MNNTLESWLETATRNLAPRAVTQIGNEITAHVWSAVEQHQLVEGMGEKPAFELAVKQLGSAKASARGYQRVHLTVGEFKALDWHDLPGTQNEHGHAHSVCQPLQEFRAQSVFSTACHDRYVGRLDLWECFRFEPRAKNADGLLDLLHGIGGFLCHDPTMDDVAKAAHRLEPT